MKIQNYEYLQQKTQRNAAKTNAILSILTCNVQYRDQTYRSYAKMALK